ncbi:MAG: glutamate-cysteine ligase family protein [Gordonibacter sp.]|uniref:glutamate-cysteine ligase family protein n=1 Tax=Gordonibacter sp. TaxID=1968902 RepID=UPI002FC85BBE
MKKTATATPAESATDDAGNSGRPQPARASNIDAIVSYFESGIIGADEPGEVGIELEHTIVRSDKSPVSYHGPHGVEWLLGQLKEDFPKTTCDPEGDLLGVARPGEAVTIEPAAQLELSAGPFKTLEAARATFQAFENKLSEMLAPVGQQVLTEGYHPTATAESLELIPKRRYQFMNLYLGNIGPFGPRMMRGSASTQVSIDYYSVSDCLRKLRLAFALVPLFSLVCDNSPAFEGKPRTHQLVRTEIWQHCDPNRCGLVPGALDHAFNLRRYAEYLLDTPAILAPCRKEQWCYSERTFGEIYAERTMTRGEVEHAVSMLFNDVRLKTYIEIRPADALPIPYVIAYAALIKGLFYHEENLDALDELFAHVDADAFEKAKDELMACGYEAEVYGRPVASLVDEVMALGRRGLAENERAYLEPLAQLAAQHTTLANLTELQG